jgi:ubiquinol-cytochrome c reductase cytochrome b subunit
MFFGLVIIILLYVTDLGKLKSLSYKPYVKIIFFIFVGDFLILMKLGAEHVENPYIILGLSFTILYFVFFSFIVPLISKMENLNIDISSSMKQSINYSELINTPRFCSSNTNSGSTGNGKENKNVNKSNSQSANTGENSDNPSADLNTSSSASSAGPSNSQTMH